MHMLLIVLMVAVHFLVGAVASCIFDFLWDLHWFGKMFLLAICATAVGVVLFDISGFIASLDVWYLELSQLIGIVMGPRIVKWMSLERCARAGVWLNALREEESRL